jgi:hypothetical protein
MGEMAVWHFIVKNFKLSVHLQEVVAAAVEMFIYVQPHI